MYNNIIYIIVFYVHAYIIQRTILSSSVYNTYIIYKKKVVDLFNLPYGVSNLSAMFVHVSGDRRKSPRR